MSNLSTYHWVITVDHLYEWERSEGMFDTLGKDYGRYSVGIEGPRDYALNVKMDKRWRCKDDDGIVYYEGIIGGEFSGFEPLDDFCMPDSGCTEIEYWNKESGTWELI